MINKSLILLVVNIDRSRRTSLVGLKNAPKQVSTELKNDYLSTRFKQNVLIKSFPSKQMFGNNSSNLENCTTRLSS